MMQFRGLLPLSLLVSGLISTGCDPFDDTETNIPLPPKVWDNAVKVKNHRLFVIKNISSVEFLNIKSLLLTSGYTEQKKDFYFVSTAKGAPYTVKSAGNVLLLGKERNANNEYSAVVYVPREEKLMLGTGYPEQ